ncbi:unnamed protein product [Onchocerca flexuosa]|uniref:SH3 domain-containing protein n=1 Tax=Onchocerca flexuosa TaxID=387005 RepID=A0A3P8BLM8_9BILA|nr:unnamed protein product [Onchocerca flexuosa]
MQPDTQSVPAQLIEIYISAHEQVAVESYRAERNNEIDLKIGDTIGIAGNHWNGFSMGTNRRTGKKGLYPSYKAREKYIVLDFP